MPAPGGLKGDLDAVAVEVPEIDGLGDEVVGGRDAHIALQGADRELGEVRAGRHVNGDVIEPGCALYRGPNGAGLEYDQHLAAGAKPQLVTRFGHEVEADDVLPDGE